MPTKFYRIPENKKLASLVLVSGSLFLLGQVSQVQADEIESESSATQVTILEKQAEAVTENLEQLEEAVFYQETPQSNLLGETQSLATPLPPMEVVVQPKTTSPQEIAASLPTNLKKEVHVPESYLKAAQSPGPFTAGVNEVIPYEAFGGDGMLTRLILTAADQAPWSDNGSAMNPALAPLDQLEKGRYFYALHLEGAAKDKVGAELLNVLQQQAQIPYQGQVTIYDSKNGMADLTKVIASQAVRVTFQPLLLPEDLRNAVLGNTKNKVHIPQDYLKKAQFPGPFTAGVNQIIPLEAFGGDGMLTRLILTAADQAPWSDNGTAMNPTLAIAANLPTGQYFYSVSLTKAGKGLMDQELLTFLKQYQDGNLSATITIYGSKDGKVDPAQVLATKEVSLYLEKMPHTMHSAPSSQAPKHLVVPSSMTKNLVENLSNTTKSMHIASSWATSSQNKNPNQVMNPEQKLPSTGETSSASLSLLGLLGLLSGFHLLKKSPFTKNKQN